MVGGWGGWGVAVSTVTSQRVQIQQGGPVEVLWLPPTSLVETVNANVSMG